MTLISLVLAIAAGVPPSAWDPAELVPVAVPEPSVEALAYYHSGIWIWVGVNIWRLAVPALILFTGLSGRIRDVANRLGRGWFATISAYMVMYLTLVAIINIPLDYYLGYIRPLHYGLSDRDVVRWGVQELKGFAVMVVGAVLVVWVPYLLIARSPRRWWLYTGLLTLPFALVMATVMPIWIDPLFNTFAPMKNKALEAKILALGNRAGIASGHVFEVDKSRDTNTVNAYVTGLFGTKRIVLWDTLLKGHTDKEVLAVMGHEMGHYVLNHVAWGVSLSVFGSLLLLFLVNRSAIFLISRFGPRFGFDRLSDVASVPLFVCLLTLFNLIGSPVALAISRHMEHEADCFALEITRTNHSAGAAFAKMQRENLSNPRPARLSILLRSSHPPLGDRIDFCNRYHPWTEGLPGRYDALFAAPGRDGP
jgi:STE24 endopeptidase